MQRKAALEFDEVVKFLLVLLVLLFMIATLVILKMKGINLIDKIKDLLIYG